MTAAAIAVDRGAKWLVSVQGQDGGWGQDGGETSYVRQGRASGIERQRRSEHGRGGDGSAACRKYGGRRAIPCGSATRGELHPASCGTESRRRTHRHGPQRYADPAKTGAVYRHVSELQAAGRAGRQHGRCAAECARARRVCKNAWPKSRRTSCRTEAGTWRAAGRRSLERPWPREACTWLSKKAWPYRRWRWRKWRSTRRRVPRHQPEARAPGAGEWKLPSLADLLQAR